MDISFTEREKISGMVKQLMSDYEKPIEEAYLATEGMFKVAFVAKIEPQANAKKITVEMAFDPSRKIKDKMVEILDPDQMKLPLKDRQSEDV